MNPRFYDYCKKLDPKQIYDAHIARHLSSFIVSYLQWNIEKKEDKNNNKP